MKKALTIVPAALVGSLLLLPNTVWSQQTFQQPEREISPYVGGGIGYYRLNDGNFLDEDERLKDDRYAWRAFAGVDFARFLALEAGYIDFAKASSGNASLDVDGWTAAVVGAIPLTQTFALTGKVGNLWWDATQETGAGGRSSDSGDDIFYGVGVRFSMTPNTDLRVEYDRYEVDDVDLDTASLNLQYRF